MQTELRYQARMHAISNKPREKNILQILPFFFLLLKKKKKATYMKNLTESLSVRALGQLPKCNDCGNF